MIRIDNLRINKFKNTLISNKYLNRFLNCICIALWVLENNKIAIESYETVWAKHKK